MTDKYFLPFWACLLTLLFPLWCRNFLVPYDSSCLLLLSLYDFGVTYKKLFPLCFLQVVSEFRVLHLGLRTVFSSFLYREREKSSIILFHVCIQFSECHLLKRLSFHQYVLVTFIENWLDVDVWVYFWNLYSVTLICRSGVLFCFLNWGLNPGVL